MRVFYLLFYFSLFFPSSLSHKPMLCLSHLYFSAFFTLFLHLTVNPCTSLFFFLYLSKMCNSLRFRFSLSFPWSAPCGVQVFLISTPSCSAGFFSIRLLLCFYVSHETVSLCWKISISSVLFPLTHVGWWPLHCRFLFLFFSLSSIPRHPQQYCWSLQEPFLLGNLVSSPTSLLLTWRRME